MAEVPYCGLWVIWLYLCHVRAVSYTVIIQPGDYSASLLLLGACGIMQLPTSTTELYLKLSMSFTFNWCGSCCGNLHFLYLTQISTQHSVQNRVLCLKNEGNSVV
jgi:hypothetical protein